MINKKLKFSTNPESGFIADLREKVKIHFETKKVSKYGNVSLALKSIFMATVYFLPYFLMISGLVTSVPFLLLCWIATGFGMAGVGMGLMHDANHGAFSKNKHLNSLLGGSIFLLGGYPPNWKFQHNTLHHAYTNIDGHDEDISTIGLLRFSPHKPKYKIHKFQHWYAWFFYGLMTLMWSTTKDFVQLNRYRESGSAYFGKKTYNRVMMEIILGKIIYYAVFLVVPLLTLPISWYWIVLGYLSMHFTAGFILGIVFQTAHVVTDTEFPLPDENGNVQNSWAIHQLCTTSDYSPKNRLFSWLIGGLNFQVEHHLFPNISHVHYRRLSKIVKETAQKYHLPYHVQPTFFSALLNHAKMLKSLGS